MPLVAACHAGGALRRATATACVQVAGQHAGAALMLREAFAWCTAHETVFQRIFAGDTSATLQRSGARFDHLLVDEVQGTKRLLAALVVAPPPKSRGFDATVLAPGRAESALTEAFPRPTHTAMNDNPAAQRPGHAADAADMAQPAWRDLSSRAHQLRAATRAADHFNAQDRREDRNTGSWLMSCALSLAVEMASDLDGMARALKERPVDAASMQKMANLRMRAHQLHAAARAADHFLDQDCADGRDTGSWLIATASTLAARLAGEIDDSLGAGRRPMLDKTTVESQDAALTRRMSNSASMPLRGAA